MWLACVVRRVVGGWWVGWRRESRLLGKSRLGLLDGVAVFEMILGLVVQWSRHLPFFVAVRLDSGCWICIAERSMMV